MVGLPVLRRHHQEHYEFARILQNVCEEFPISEADIIESDRVAPEEPSHRRTMGSLYIKKRPPVTRSRIITHVEKVLAPPPPIGVENREQGTLQDREADISGAPLTYNEASIREIRSIKGEKNPRFDAQEKAWTFR